MSATRAKNLLGLAQRGGRLVSGDAAVHDALRRRRAALLIIAADAGPATQRTFRQLSERRSVPCLVAYNKAELGRVLGRSPRAVVAVTDPGLAKGLMELLHDGEGDPVARGAPVE